jgi:hypothetical protein
MTRFPWACAALVLCAGVLSAAPFGAYPLNDDWVYTHIAKVFAATGQMRMDVPAAASTVGQSLIAAPVIIVFGFSFFALRVLTMAFAAVCMWALDRMLVMAGLSLPMRLASLLLLALNPIFFYCSSTFMTEVYAWTMSTLSVVVWFHGRRSRMDDRVIIRLSNGVAAAAIAAFSFSIRQPAVVAFAAAVCSTLLHVVVRRQFTVLRSSVWALGASGAVFIGGVLLFLGWSRSTGNVPPWFTNRLPNLVRIDVFNIASQSGAALIYMTLYFLPFLILFAAALRHRRTLLLALLPFGVAVATHALFQATAPTDHGLGLQWNHRWFPYLMNLLYSGGLGPITTNDVFWHHLRGPAWPVPAMRALNIALLASTLLWAPAAMAWLRSLRQATGTLAFELRVYGIALFAFSLMLMVQTHQDEVADRYHLPLILALTVLVPSALSTIVSDMPSRLLRVVWFACFLPIAGYSLLGMHDMFRWSDVRTALLDAAIIDGAHAATVDAGVEPNCFADAEGLTPATAACGAEPCHCLYKSFCCRDDQWRIGINVPPGYEVIDTMRPDWWLVDGPAFTLAKRPPISEETMARIRRQQAP